MPVDSIDLLTPSDYKLVQRVRQQRGDAAGLALARRIANRAGTTAAVKNAKIADMVRDDGQDHAWPVSMLTRPLGKKR